ncbi:hypothetical protein K402DRAFT_215668 [Aulographum hederae CBS 113979]|uniref:Uncharacterized protein n=1 Tax=Aulographum hederae CBS 113979 TaxID=1176131 RepID=A0A6G1GLX9_9PEZI|nr:hypothetical protein K402DRAFT_215668 [Aulographum hederae CBS 113979]
MLRCTTQTCTYCALILHRSLTTSRLISGCYSSKRVSSGLVNPLYNWNNVSYDHSAGYLSTRTIYFSDLETAPSSMITMGKRNVCISLKTRAWNPENIAIPKISLSRVPHPSGEKGVTSMKTSVPARCEKKNPKEMPSSSFIPHKS